jgi:hypothetical protein
MMTSELSEKFVIVGIMRLKSECERIPDLPNTDAVGATAMMPLGRVRHL